MTLIFQPGLQALLGENLYFFIYRNFKLEFEVPPVEELTSRIIFSSSVILWDCNRVIYKVPQRRTTLGVWPLFEELFYEELIKVSCVGA